MGEGATTGERTGVRRAGARGRSPGGLLVGRGPGRIAWLAVAPALLALAAPLPAGAQPAPRVARVGYLSPLSAGPMSPNARRFAFLSDATPTQTLADAETAGRAMGVRVSALLVHTPREVDRAFANFRKAPVDGLIVSLTLKDHWRQIVDLARRNRLPTVSGPREFAEAGGLMAYGPHSRSLPPRRLLRGQDPEGRQAGRPARRAATKFELVINRRTARALGLAIPRSLVLQADRVID